MKTSRQIMFADSPVHAVCTGFAILFLACASSVGAQSPSSAPGTPAVQLPPSAGQRGGVGVHQSAPAPSGSVTDVEIQIQGPYAGSIPGADTPPATLEMTLAEAIRRGLLTNLGVISSTLSVQQAAAQRAQARSALLPAISANASENAEKIDLAAEGFTPSTFAGGIGQFPTTAGPFHYYDLHGALQQSLLDVTAIRNLRAQDHVYRAALLDSRQAREEVVLAVTGVYLQLMADLALVERQSAEVKYAEAIYKQAKTEVDAGNKAPIEGNRSLVELQAEQQRLRSQMGEVEKRQITLSRLIGIPPGTHIQPQEHLETLASDFPPVQDLVQRAWSQRQDLKAGYEQVLAAEEPSRRLPRNVYLPHP